MSVTGNQCRRCLRIFVPTGDDPAVSAASLGAGIYHLACARLAWRDRANKTEAQRTARAEKRRVHGSRLAQWRAKLDAQIAAVAISEEDS